MVAEFKLSDAQVIPACNTDDTSFAEVCNSNANTNTVQIQCGGNTFPYFSILFQTDVFCGANLALSFVQTRLSLGKV